MPIRAMWKGVIHFDSIRVPVKLYGAIEDRNVHFRLLHRQGMEPVHQAMANPETGEAVPNEEIRRAFITESGDHVPLDKPELEALEPKRSREIDLKRFVPISSINPVYFERAYFLVPDGDTTKSYRLLAKSMEDGQKAGIATFVMHGKDYLVAIIAWAAASYIPRTQTSAFSEAREASQPLLIRHINNITTTIPGLTRNPAKTNIGALCAPLHKCRINRCRTRTFLPAASSIT